MPIYWIITKTEGCGGYGVVVGDSIQLTSLIMGRPPNIIRVLWGKTTIGSSRCPLCTPLYCSPIHMRSLKRGEEDKIFTSLIYC